MQPISKIYLKDWQDYKSLFESYDNSSKKYIFRGHSNSINEKNEFIEWGLESSFNRKYKRSSVYSFENLLTQQFEPELFKIYYSNHRFPQIKELVNATTLEKCYFFQHYGIPTCFIDFTFDPLTALYFSITSIEGNSGGTYDNDGNLITYSEDQNRDFVTVYQIEPLEFLKVFNIKEINRSDFDVFNLESYRAPALTFSPNRPLLAFDLNPTSTASDQVINFNLQKQDGCFLFYDNKDIGMSLEKYIEDYCKFENIQIDAPLITKYYINYNCLYKKRGIENRNLDTVFTFLQKKGRTGEKLFEDLQGLKYDFNLFHQQ